MTGFYTLLRFSLVQGPHSLLIYRQLDSSSEAMWIFFFIKSLSCCFALSLQLLRWQCRRSLNKEPVVNFVKKSLCALLLN